MQGNGCGALWNLAANTENQVKIAAAGGIEAVKRALKAHKDAAAVQEKGKQCLKLLKRK